ncbi:unnamed protein product, partial [Ascophyllum nodosum]
YGPTWAGKDIVENFYDAKDYLGIILSVAISTVGISLTALDTARIAGDACSMRETLLVGGIGTMVCSLFGSPFGTMFVGHPVHKKSGGKTGYSFISGIAYVLLSSYFGLVAPIRSIVNKPTLAPIVLFAGFVLLEKCFRLLPSRHYVAVVFGLFPSTCDWVMNITARTPLAGLAEDGAAYNSNLPGLSEGWWGMLGFKRGAILVSLCWVAILVHIIDRKWWQAGVWALFSSILTAVGLIHVQVTGFDVFTKTAGILYCSPVTEDDDIVASATCWEHGNWLQYFIAYLMMGVV